MAPNYRTKAAQERLIIDADAALSAMRYIMDRSEAVALLDSIDPDWIVALDFETTGLDPRYSKVRLSCIYHPELGIVLLDHFFCGSFEDLCSDMLTPMWVVYNAKFEVRWFDHFLPNQVDLIDVDFLAKAHRGGEPRHWLAWSSATSVLCLTKKNNCLIGRRRS
jgi:hypothetical protein